MEVKSTVIDYPTQTMDITDTAGEKHTIPLDTRIRVTMIGYPDLVTKSMLAHELGNYMSMGYIIERIIVEEGAAL